MHGKFRGMMDVGAAKSPVAVFCNIYGCSNAFTHSCMVGYCKYKNMYHYNNVSNRDDQLWQFLFTAMGPIV
jgi:hypothetical protein